MKIKKLLLDLLTLGIAAVGLSIAFRAFVAGALFQFSIPSPTYNSQIWWNFLFVLFLAAIFNIVKGRRWRALVALQIVAFATLECFFICMHLSPEARQLPTSEIEASDDFSLALDIISGQDPVRIDRAELVEFPKSSTSSSFEYEYYDQAPQFSGFRGTKLQAVEIAALIPLLQNAPRSLDQVTVTVGRSATLPAYNEFEENKQSSGVLIFYSGYRRLILRFGLYAGKAMFFSREDLSNGTNDRELRLISEEAAPLIASIVPRATINIPMLYPELSPSDALLKMSEQFGDDYRESVTMLRQSGNLKSIIGPIKEIRPAIGSNSAFTWMDFSSKYTFRVVGELRQVVVLASCMEKSRSIQVIADGEIVGSYNYEEFDSKTS